MHSIRKLFDRDRSAQQNILFQVRPIAHVGFGVFAHAVLISIHIDLAVAVAHCQRLRNQKVSHIIDIEERIRLEYLVETSNTRICDLEELPDRSHDEDAELTKLWAERDGAEHQLNAAL